MQNLDPKENEKLDQKEEEQHSDSDGSDGDDLRANLCQQARSSDLLPNRSQAHLDHRESQA